MHLPRLTFTLTICLLLLGLASCTPSSTQQALQPSQALGAVLAEETLRAAGSKKDVVLLVPQWAANSSVGAGFTAALKKKGCTVRLTLTVNVGNPMESRASLGLKAADFLDAMEKGSTAGAIVSLAGSPLLTARDAAKVSVDHPPVLVVATGSLGEVMGIPGNPAQLAGLMAANIIQLAIVDGDPQPAVPGSGPTDSAHQVFSEHYQILRRPN